MRVIDMHCDTISRLCDLHRQGIQEESLLSNKGHLDLEKLKKGKYLLQNFALFVDTGKCENPWERVLELYEEYQKDMNAYEQIIKPVLCYEDIENNRRQGKLSALLTVEEGAVLEGKLERLDTLHHFGVRMLTLTWNYPNEVGFPNRKVDIATEKKQLIPETDRGLTEFGIEVVERMEQLHMIPDVSHLSDRGFWDVFNATSKPFVASHSNARTICSHPRNMTDDMIRALAQKGGCMGLNFYVDFLTDSKNPDNQTILSSLAEQAWHIVNVGGIEVLGLGSDFDGIDTNPVLPGAHIMNVLWNTLKQKGFTESQLDYIFEKNVLRVYKDCL